MRALRVIVLWYDVVQNEHCVNITLTPTLKMHTILEYHLYYEDVSPCLFFESSISSLKYVFCHKYK